MSYSLNEIEVTAKRATRGAGYAWGLTEEAGKATRWLCAQGMDGPAALAQLLGHGFAKSVDRHAPDYNDAVWTGPEVLCPLITGALLSDCANMLTTGAIEIRQVAMPVLLLPFAANVARSNDTVVTVTHDRITAVTDGLQLSITTAFPDHGDCIGITVGGSMTNPHQRLTRATPDTTDWDILNRFAHRTYAPATEESRLLGAGAGLSDND